MRDRPRSRLLEMCATDPVSRFLNIYSEVGLVTLVGLVSKNGILIVEFANQQQRRGLPKVKAVREAALVRLRPVLMTSAATICDHFPLTLVRGAGAAARNSIGITVVSGMAIGTIFTLLVIPSIYVLLAKQHTGEESVVTTSDLDLVEAGNGNRPEAENEETPVTAFTRAPLGNPAPRT